MILAVQFPSWLRPEIIPGLPFRWYGLMYLVAFGIAWLLYRQQVRERNFPISEEQLSSLFFWGILSLVLGARILSTMVYETHVAYYRQPWLVFWPFQNGRFTGLSGMSYHGGVIGGILAILIYSARHRFDYREIGDMFAASIPLGYTAGRLGNFINGELYGRVTSGPLGMIFPGAELSTRERWVRELAEKMNIPAVGDFVNLPRHPSQLYEALFEGVVLWIIIWLLRNKKPFKGFLVGIYLAGYGFFRFLIEYFREPDADLGYRITLVKTRVPPALFTSPFNFSTGQIFCFAMIVLALVWLLIASRLPDREPVRVYPPAGGDAAERKEESRQTKRGTRKN
ncbi:MAG: prolipoprotein diacylglyceryl transferase [Spirochaetaceae bacterium]|jgi:phosphatidylglycerol:prolipoprotein diacylglycerol transferase|nr:prolipoprotein diacylglyceryl transferase [Spirochaetaceae bacterium]